jgi:hypothetical protein
MAEIPEWLEKKAQESQQRTANKHTAEVIQLPLWKHIERAIPNHIARSSLFAPIARGRRKMHDKELLVSRGDVSIYYTGKQLDEADCDVWMQLLHIANQYPLGEPVPINRAEVLRSIGRATGNKDYLWLHESIRRLHLGAIEIETNKYIIKKGPRVEALHLLDGFTYEPEDETYYLRLDKRLIQLFSHAEFALVDWEKRFMITHRIDLAKRLQRLVATSSDKTQRYSLKYLKEVCCYNSPMRKFKDALLEALEELERLHIIRNPQFEMSRTGEEQARWLRL